MKRILVIDNYDSFVYNAVQLLRESQFKPCVEVVRNDAVATDRLGDYAAVVLSPGPGIPCEAGQLMEVIDRVIRLRIPTLGICLGHQALAEAFGGRLIQLEAPLHGHSSQLRLTDAKDVLWQGIDDPIVGRYHSWTVDAESIADRLNISSTDQAGNVMSFYHPSLPIHGVQFHPESVITDCGRRLIANWLGSFL